MKKYKIIYFGSKISKYKNTKASMETIEPLLAQFCEIKTFSSKTNKLSKLFNMVSNFFRYGLYSDKIIIDVFSTSAFYYAFMLSILSFFLNKKYILILRGGNLPSRFLKNKKLVTFIFKNAKHVVAPSLYLKSFFVDEGFTIRYIPNFIEIEQYKFKQRNILEPTILSLRGFDKPYNPIMTLKAINLLKDKHEKIKLLLLGNKNEYYYKEVLEYIQYNKLETYVTISNKVSRKEWLELSENYDIMVSTPIIDNTPVSIIEGMALGMCIVSTNVGGVSYLLEDGKDSILVENNNELELTNAIELLLNDNTFSYSLSKNAREKASNFDWSKIKEEWQNIIAS
jgi:glycosyltransferase involved in cell wall biosynthesis